MSQDPSAASPAAPAEASPQSDARRALEKTSPLRVTYITVVILLLLYIFSVKAAEWGLQTHFDRIVAEAIDVDPDSPGAVRLIKNRLDTLVKGSQWVRIWEVSAFVVVLARDQGTILYIDGHAPTLSRTGPGGGDAPPFDDASLLPASAHIQVSVPHNAMLSNTILIFFASILFSSLFAYHRNLVDLENLVIDEVHAERDAAARRAASIEGEIEEVRRRVMTLEPSDRANREEVGRLRSERQKLEQELVAVAARERELRGKEGEASQLEQERSALEELLEEASGDLASKDEEIEELERSLKRATRSGGGKGGRAKEIEVLGKRMRTLYATLELDDRVIEHMVDQRDEATKLRVEECIKRLSEDADNVGVRRKVGGLPGHLSIYELGFSGKRRLYYRKGDERRFRVLLVGAKNTQDADMEYLSRLPNPEADEQPGYGFRRKGREGRK